MTGGVRSQLHLDQEAEAVKRRLRPTSALVPAGVGGGRAGIVALQAAAGNAAVARALSGAGPTVVQTLKARPTVWGWSKRAVFAKGEMLSKVEGAESDTGNFAHSSGSELLDPVNARTLRWNGSEFGVLRPFGHVHGGTFVPAVKLHLVNSYLHPDANSWPDNWVWGHKQLNVNHVGPEGKAKQVKHAAVGRGGGIQYRTEVTAKGPIVQSLNEMAQAIADQIQQDGANLVAALAWPTAAAVQANVTVGGQSLADFHAAWSTAVQQTVGTALDVSWRSVESDGTAGATGSQTVTCDDEAEARPTITTAGILRLVGAGAITEAPRGSRKRTNSTPAGVLGPPTTKKTKFGGP